jgi:metal-sulfur cluster biosynthetic enzyme
LATISDPCSLAAGRPVDIVSMGLVEDIRIDHGHA